MPQKVIWERLRRSTLETAPARQLAMAQVELAGDRKQQRPQAGLVHTVLEAARLEAARAVLEAARLEADHAVLEAARLEAAELVQAAADA